MSYGPVGSNHGSLQKPPLLALGHRALQDLPRCTVYFLAKEKSGVTLPHSAQRKHAFLGEIKEMSKTKKLTSRNKIALEFLHQRLGHVSTISLLSGDTTNFGENIEIRIYPDPFFTSCQISSMKKKARSKIH